MPVRTIKMRSDATFFEKRTVLAAHFCNVACAFSSASSVDVRSWNKGKLHSNDMDEQATYANDDEPEVVWVTHDESGFY